MLDEIGRILLDQNLKDRSKLIMIYIITMPSDLDINKPDLSRLFGVSERTIQRYISELRNNGYIRYVNIHDEKGDFAGGYYEAIPMQDKG